MRNCGKGKKEQKKTEIMKEKLWKKSKWKIELKGGNQDGERRQEEKKGGKKDERGGNRKQEEECFTLQSNQRFIKELQIHIKTCSFELCKFCLKVKHAHTHTLIRHFLSLFQTPHLSVHTHTHTVCINLHMSRVFVSAASVGDDIEVALVCLCHYEVIHNPSFLIGEEGQRTLWGWGGERICR